MQPLLRLAISVLAFLALVLSASEAAAQGVNTQATKSLQRSKDESPYVALIPATKNSQLSKIASLYENLEYEKALALMAMAERHPANRMQERLWLELMKGVLHHGLRKGDAKADAAFLRALEQSPYSPLPILKPSQTLHERFEMLRGQLLQQRERKQEAENKQTPELQLPPIVMFAIPEASAQMGGATKEDSKQAPLAKKSPQQEGALPPQPADIEHQLLLNRFYQLEGWLGVRSQGRTPEDLSNEFDECFQHINAAKTAHERVLAASRLDNLHEQMRRRFEPQGSDMKLAPLLPRRPGASEPSK